MVMVEQALRLVREVLDIRLHGRNATNLAIWFTSSAAYRIAFGELDGAHEAACEGLRWARQNALPIAWAL